MGSSRKSKASFCSHGQELLRDSGLKITTQRATILEVYAGTRGHWTPQEIYAELESRQPSMSLATVYNTLETFEEVGLVKRFLRPDGQTVFDRNTALHHHAICVECRVIIDVSIPEDKVAALLDESSTVPEFDVHGADVWYRGMCHRCR